MSLGGWWRARRARLRRLGVASAALPDRGPLADSSLAKLIVLSAPEVPVDGDAIVRRVVVKVGRDVAFGAAVTRSEVSEPGQVLPINFVGPSGSFLTIPSDAVAAIGDAGADLAGDNPLRGRIVLVGGTFQDGRAL